MDEHDSDQLEDASVGQAAAGLRIQVGSRIRSDGHEYIVESIIGHGGFGSVYRCRHALAHTSFALKVPNEDMREYGNVERELEALILLSSSSQIITIKDMLLVRNRAGLLMPLMLMPFAESGSLDRYLIDPRQVEPVPAQRVGAVARRSLFGELLNCDFKGTLLVFLRMLDIMLQAGTGLSYAHQQGVVHADIKPPNILVMGEGVNDMWFIDVRVGDFGNVGLQGGGSLGFRSFEQQHGLATLTAKTDVWSLAITFLAMANAADQSQIPLNHMHPMIVALYDRTKILTPDRLKRHIRQLLEPLFVEMMELEGGEDAAVALIGATTEVIASCLARDPETRIDMQEFCYEISGLIRSTIAFFDTETVVIRELERAMPTAEARVITAADYLRMGRFYSVIKRDSDAARAKFKEAYNLDKSGSVIIPFFKFLSSSGQRTEAVELLMDWIFGNEDVDRPNANKNIDVVNKLIKYFVDTADTEAANELFAALPTLGVKPTVETIGYMVQLANNSAAVAQLYKILCELPLKPKKGTYNMFIKAYARCGNQHAVTELLEHMVAEMKRDPTIRPTLTPDVFTYTSAIDGFAESGDKEGAERYLHEMEEKKLAPDNFTLTSVLRVIVNCKYGLGTRFRDIGEVLARFAALGKPVRPEEFAYNRLFEACVQIHELDRDQDDPESIRHCRAWLVELLSRPDVKPKVKARSIYDACLTVLGREELDRLGMLEPESQAEATGPNTSLVAEIREMIGRRVELNREREEIRAHRQREIDAFRAQRDKAPR